MFLFVAVCLFCLAFLDRVVGGVATFAVFGDRVLVAPDKGLSNRSCKSVIVVIVVGGLPTLPRKGGFSRLLRRGSSDAKFGCER